MKAESGRMNKSTEDSKSMDAIAAANSGIDAIEVAVHSGQESWSGTLDGHVVSVSGPEKKSIVKFLCRDKILTLVLERPQGRSDARKGSGNGIATCRDFI